MDHKALHELRAKQIAALDRLMLVSLQVDGVEIDHCKMNGAQAYRNALASYGNTHALRPSLRSGTLVIFATRNP